MPFKNSHWFKLTLGALAIPLVAAMFIPNLLRSRSAADYASYMAGLVPRAEAAQAAGGGQKIIRTVSLSLLVKETGTAEDKIQGLSESMGGLVEKSSRSYGERRTSTICVRVPSEHLAELLSEIKTLAIRVDRENSEARDSTREYIDLDAQLRNAQAEEMQYLQILKRASSVKDTLEVSAKLADVRGRIEHFQGEMNYMTSQIALSRIDISLWSNEDGASLGVAWRPLHKARAALADLISGLADWADDATAFLVKLPLIVLWLLSVSVLFMAVWRPLRFAWQFLRSNAGRKLTGMPLLPVSEIRAGPGAF